jgi:hypothetical protein
MKNFYTLLTVFLLGVASGCENNSGRNFPNVSFEEYVYLNNPTSLPLLNIGGAITHPGGYNGLLVYRRYLGNANDFAAYDRGCPTHYREDCGQLTISDDQSFAECSCGGEKYLLFDGSPSELAETSLVEYPATQNAGVLVIRN